jgi:hypothetical protein
LIEGIAGVETWTPSGPETETGPIAGVARPDSDRLGSAMPPIEGVVSEMDGSVMPARLSWGVEMVSESARAGLAAPSAIALAAAPTAIRRMDVVMSNPFGDGRLSEAT